MELKTTNAISAIFFLTLLGAVKKPSLEIGLKSKVPAAKYASELIDLSYYVYLSTNEWPWTIEHGILNGFSDEELSEFLAGEIDGDGSVVYYYNDETELVFVYIIACKACPKRIVLDVLKEVITKRFGIVGTIDHFETADVLVFRGEKAVKLLRRVVKYIHHPLRRLRVELILALYDRRISLEVFEKLYEQTEYDQGAPDVKRSRGLEALAQAAPQTHTHGGTKHEIESMVD